MRLNNVVFRAILSKRLKTLTVLCCLHSRVVLSEAVDWCICFTRKIQHGGDWERSRPRGPKNVHNFLITVRLLSWACGHETEMLLILKKTIFDLTMPRYFPIWQFKEMSHDFVRGQSMAKTCFSHWGYCLQARVSLHYNNNIILIITPRNAV